MKFNTTEKKVNNPFSFSRIGGKTIEVAGKSKGFFLYQKLLSLLLVLVFGLLLTRIYFSNQLAVSGGFVSVNSQRIEQLRKENYQLENKISELSALNYVNSQAEKLGLVKISKIEILKTDTGVALKP